MRLRIICLILLILVLKILQQELPHKHFQNLTKQFQILISLKLIQQLNLLTTKLNKVWRWKLMTFFSSKIISNQLVVCQLKLNCKFWTLTGQTTAVTQPLKLSSNILISQRLNSKNNCKQLMINTLLCVMN